ncbi:MAG: phage terminase large subunit [Clostridia bacterium]|nr:phage terminase large subunit [Clostridia bacterium]MBO7249737.1 phage terminase large subunit [Clostridia bacterium]
MKKQRQVPHEVHISGTPNEKQKQFFASRTRFTAYGGARGGGKSWALRRKLTAMCLRYPGIRCLIVRRSYEELKANHVIPFLREYGALISYSDSEKIIAFSNGSRIYLGYCSCDRDTLRYQGQEYDVIAIDEATQISEYQFSIFKACLRGVGRYPRRMYLTCNPGGVGHAWVKRLFIDRNFRDGENPRDYSFVSARVFDNTVLCSADPEYLHSLESLPKKLKDAWLYGRWDVFEGQFFPEFDPDVHVVSAAKIPSYTKNFIAIDYGFDMLAVLLMGVDTDGVIFCRGELCQSGLTLSEAAERIAAFCRGERVDYAVASPDLWNRRQDSGRSGFEIMQNVSGMPPMIPADDRRIAGWRVLREYLSAKEHSPKLYISSCCTEIIRCLPALLCDAARVEDASGEPHSITHAPEALRYAVMSRFSLPERGEREVFAFQKKKKNGSRLFD